VVACVVGSESKRLGLDLCDLAGDPTESEAWELCARCGLPSWGRLASQDALKRCQNQKTASKD
jgi:hypothetical protein